MLFCNYRISLSLMLLMIIVHLAQCCLIFQKKFRLLFIFFQKKTSQKIVAYKPLLIKQNECILIRVHPNQCSKNSHGTVLTTRGGSDLSLPLSHFQSWFEEDSNQGRDAETHCKSSGTYGDVRMNHSNSFKNTDN